MKELAFVVTVEVVAVCLAADEPACLLKENRHAVEDGVIVVFGDFLVRV